MTLVWFNDGFYKYLFPLMFLLGFLNHKILVLTLPAFLFFLFMHIEPRGKRIFLRICAVLIALFVLSAVWLLVYHSGALMLYLDAILLGPPSIAHYLKPPKDWLRLLEEFAFYFFYLWYQFPFFCFPLGVFGLFRFFKDDKITAFFLLLIMALNGLFFMKTTSWPSYGSTKYTFYITDYLIFSIFLGYGYLSLLNWLTAFLGRFKALSGMVRKKALLNISVILLFVAATIGFYSTMPCLVPYIGVDLLKARTLPYRDNSTFFLNPNKRGYFGDRKFGEEILDLVQKDSVIFADFTPYTILKYLIEIENRRPDILLMPVTKMPMGKCFDEIRQNNPTTRIYVADNNAYYDLDGVKEKYLLRKAGPIFEIVPGSP